MGISLVLKSNAAEMTKDVLHLSVGMTSGSTAKVVDDCHASEDEVDHGDHNKGTNGITPDNDNGNDRGVVAEVMLEVRGSWVG